VLLEDFLQRAIAHAFITGMKDWKVRLQCLTGSDSPINNALFHALRAEVAKVVAVPQARIKGYSPNGNMATSVQIPQDWTHHISWQCGDGSQLKGLWTQTWLGWPGQGK
jgi:hypothetical protein